MNHARSQNNYSGPTTLGYSQMRVLTEMSEAEVLNSIMRGHDTTMTVLTSRHRSLQIISSVWTKKDLKVIGLKLTSNSLRYLKYCFTDCGGFGCGNERFIRYCRSIRNNHVETVII